jgi:hypothetical protein
MFILTRRGAPVTIMPQRYRIELFSMHYATSRHFLNQYLTTYVHDHAEVLKSCAYTSADMSYILRISPFHEFRWRLHTVIMIQFVFFAFLNVRASAFQQSETVSLSETRAASLQSRLQDFYDLQVETQTQFTSRFDGTFKDIDKESRKLRFGSLSVITSFTNTKISFNSSSEAQQDQTLAFDLTDFREKTTHTLPPAISALSPSSIYVNTFVKDTSYQSFTEISSPRTQGIGAGASWWWNGGNASASYFNYSLSSSIDGPLYKSTGSGATANISAFSGPIGFYAEVKYCYSEDFTAFSNFVNRGYDAYVSGSYNQRYLPDIVLEGGFGRHEYNGVGWTNDTTYWSATLGFDVSKYIRRPVEVKANPSPRLPTAKLLYRYLNYTDHSVAGAAPIGSQFVGLMFRTGL